MPLMPVSAEKDVVSVITEKTVLLRMEPAVHARLKAEAERQCRSLTGYIHYVLTQECGRIARRVKALSLESAQEGEEAPENLCPNCGQVGYHETLGSPGGEAAHFTCIPTLGG